MNTQDVKAGMSVEYHMSLAEVITVDQAKQTAMIRRRSDNQEMSVSVKELSQDHQFDTDVNMYYWGC